MQPIPTFSVTLNIQDWEFQGSHLHLYLDDPSNPGEYIRLRITAKPVDVYEAFIGLDSVTEYEDFMNAGEHDSREIKREVEETDITPEMLTAYVKAQMPSETETPPAREYRESQERQAWFRARIEALGPDGSAPMLAMLRELIEEEAVTQASILPF